MPETVSWNEDPITDETSLKEESRDGKEGQTLGLCVRHASSPQGSLSLCVHEPPSPVGKESLCYLKTAFVAVRSVVGSASSPVSLTGTQRNRHEAQHGPYSQTT